MRKRLSFALAMFLVPMTLACGASTPPKWEYTIVAPSDEELAARLKVLGAEGWEIIAARRATNADPGGGRPTASYEMILKRPITDAAASAILTATPPTPK